MTSNGVFVGWSALCRACITFNYFTYIYMIYLDYMHASDVETGLCGLNI